MKKSILIFCIALTTLSLTALGYNYWNDPVSDHLEIPSCNQHIEKVVPDFFYSVGTRFGGIHKVDLDKAKSIIDFLPKRQIQDVVTYKSVKITILADSKQTNISETGNSDRLTDGQLKLLRTADYSTNILVRAEYKQKNKETGELEDGYCTPHLTIVPENQAEYLDGKEALIDYLKENSKKETAKVEADKLQSGKLYFTVTEKGTISNVTLTTTSGYPAIDKKMMELMTKTPGKWAPAENEKGRKVDQKLVFSFGIIGC